MQKLHYIAEKLRETEKFREAIKLYDKVIEGYISENNWVEVTDALQGKVLTYKHIYARKRNEKYLKLATGCAKSSLEIINKYKIKDMYASGYFRMGEVCRLSNDYNEAVKNIEKAYKLSNKNKERGDYLYHLGEAVYKSGRKILGRRKIIDKDKRLVIRARQLKEIKSGKYYW